MTGTKSIQTNSLSGGGFGVYLHWPFCAAKCPYCDFNSHVRHSPPDQQQFVAAFEREIAHMAAMAPNRKVTSIFFGGGTPSLMEPRTIDAILQSVAKNWHVPDHIEITMEANPSSVEADRFKAYRAAGVNRVSLGVQALDDAQLKFLGRLHDVEEARVAIGLARDIFPRMSFDLIYSRPGQTLDAWRTELNMAIDMAADHLSLYQLTIEEQTPFYALYKAGKIKLPDQEEAAQLYELTQAVTKERGLPAYEISNHAVPGAESVHNLTYWRFQDYAGIGPGAHGRLTTNQGKMALATERHPEKWLSSVQTAGHAIVSEEMLEPDAVSDEMLLMGLRLREGMDIARYEALTGRPLDEKRIRDLLDYGYVEWLEDSAIDDQSKRLRATPAGWLVLDAVVADLAA